MSNPNALVQKLWNYCNILRDDGQGFLPLQTIETGRDRIPLHEKQTSSKGTRQP